MEDVAEYIGLPLIKIEEKRTEELYYDFCIMMKITSVLKYPVEVKLRQMLSYLQDIRVNENLEPVFILEMYLMKCMRIERYVLKV